MVDERRQFGWGWLRGRCRCDAERVIRIIEHDVGMMLCPLANDEPVYRSTDSMRHEEMTKKKRKKEKKQEKKKRQEVSCRGVPSMYVGVPSMYGELLVGRDVSEKGGYAGA